MNGDPPLQQWQASIGNEAHASPQEAAPYAPASGPGEGVAPKAIAAAIGLRSKSILLVDSNRQSRESRAKIMRTRGVRVDCVVDAAAARVHLAAEKYNLILVDPGRERERAELLVQEIRTHDARQLVGFLVGGPLFVAKSLTGVSNPTPPARPRPSATAPVVAVETANVPATVGSDFGQRIRDAEAIRDAEGNNKR
jgi:CheY-like chemotaxis protein